MSDTDFSSHPWIRWQESLIDEAISAGKLIGVFTQRDAYGDTSVLLSKDFFYGLEPIIEHTVTLEVVETEPGLKGATTSSSYKPAKMETGLVVQVPPFIEVGTKIQIDTRETKYLSRA